MRRFGFFSFLTIFATLWCNLVFAAPSLDPIFNRFSSGQELASAFLELVMMTGSRSGVIGTTKEQDIYAREILKPYLDSAFQLQRSTGERFDKNNFVPTDIDEIIIDRLSETKPSSEVRVIRYFVKTNKSTTSNSGVVLSDTWAPRLSVFKWNRARSQWQIVSQANFNYPIAAMCDAQDAKSVAPTTLANERDQALGASLARQWFNLLEKGSGRPMMNAKVQGQSAGGNGYTNAENYKPGTISKVSLSDINVSRNDNIIVVSLNAQTDATLYGNTDKLSSKKKPRLLTFLRNSSGYWKLIAVATFNPPSLIPSGISCVKSTAN